MSGLSKSHLILACSLGLSAYAGAQQSPPSAPTTAPDTKANPLQTRLLVIEAEDLGMARSIDKASFEALEKGWATSAGILVPAPRFPEVVRWARNHPNADLCVQLDLNAEWASYRWRPVSIQPATSGLLDPAGYLPNNARYIAQRPNPTRKPSPQAVRLQMGAKHSTTPD